MGDAIDRQPRVLRADAFEEGLRPVEVSVVCHKNESPTCHPVILVELWPSPSRPAVCCGRKTDAPRTPFGRAPLTLPTQGEIATPAQPAPNPPTPAPTPHHLPPSPPPTPT